MPTDNRVVFSGVGKGDRPYQSCLVAKAQNQSSRVRTKVEPHNVLEELTISLNIFATHIS